MDNVSELTKDAKSFIGDLNKNQRVVFGQISSILGQNRENIRSTIRNLDSITAKFDRGEGSLAMLLNDRMLYNSAAEATASLRNISGKLRGGKGH